MKAACKLGQVEQVYESSPNDTENKHVETALTTKKSCYVDIQVYSTNVPLRSHIRSCYLKTSLAIFVHSLSRAHLVRSLDFFELLRVTALVRMLDAGQ
jgi:hypothetical protein